MAEIITAAFVLFAIVGWLLYFNEPDRSRDYVTDLMQLVYDSDLDRDDLRRSLDHDEIEDRLERRSD